MSSHRTLDELALAYERDGFVNAGSLVEPCEVAALITDVEPYAGRLKRGEPKEGHFRDTRGA